MFLILNFLSKYNVQKICTLYVNGNGNATVLKENSSSFV